MALHLKNQEEFAEYLQILLQIGELVLRPDHHQSTDAPPAWKYYQIWTEIRVQL